MQKVEFHWYTTDISQTEVIQCKVNQSASKHPMQASFIRVHTELATKDTFFMNIYDL